MYHNGRNDDSFTVFEATTGQPQGVFQMVALLFYRFLTAFGMTTRHWGLEAKGAAASPPLPSPPLFFPNACHSERSEESLIRPFEMHPLVFIFVFETFLYYFCNIVFETICGCLL